MQTLIPDPRTPLTNLARSTHIFPNPITPPRTCSNITFSQQYPPLDSQPSTSQSRVFSNSNRYSDPLLANKRFVIYNPASTDQSGTITILKTLINPSVLGLGIRFLKTTKEGALIELDNPRNLDKLKNALRDKLIIKDFAALNPRFALKFFENTIPKDDFLKALVSQNNSIFSKITGHHPEQITTTQSEIHFKQDLAYPQ